MSELTTFTADELLVMRLRAVWAHAPRDADLHAPYRYVPVATWGGQSWEVWDRKLKCWCDYPALIALPLAAVAGECWFDA